MLKELLKPAWSVFLQAVFATVLNLILVISMVVLCSGFFTKDTGYRATVKDADGKEITTYVYEKNDGTDTKKTTYEKQGYTVETFTTRSQLAGKGLAAFYIITQFFTLMMLLAFIYPKTWQLGTKDSNAVHFGRKTEDRLYGLKLGMLAIIPGVVIWAVFMFGLTKLPITLYGMTHAGMYSIIQLIAGGTVKIGTLTVGQKLLELLTLLVIPLIAEFGYILGYKDISISEKLIYSNKKKGGKR